MSTITATRWKEGSTTAISAKNQETKSKRTAMRLPVECIDMVMLHLDIPDTAMCLEVMNVRDPSVRESLLKNRQSAFTVFGALTRDVTALCDALSQSGGGLVGDRALNFFVRGAACYTPTWEFVAPGFLTDFAQPDELGKPVFNGPVEILASHLERMGTVWETTYTYPRHSAHQYECKCYGDLVHNNAKHRISLGIQTPEVEHPMAEDHSIATAKNMGTTLSMCYVSSTRAVHLHPSSLIDMVTMTRFDVVGDTRLCFGCETMYSMMDVQISADDMSLLRAIDEKCMDFHKGRRPEPPRRAEAYEIIGKHGSEPLRSEHFGHHTCAFWDFTYKVLQRQQDLGYDSPFSEDYKPTFAKGQHLSVEFGQTELQLSSLDRE